MLLKLHKVQERQMQGLPYGRNRMKMPGWALALAEKDLCVISSLHCGFAARKANHILNCPSKNAASRAKEFLSSPIVGQYPSLLSGFLAKKDTGIL